MELFDGVRLLARASSAYCGLDDVDEVKATASDSVSDSIKVDGLVTFPRPNR